jgi:hypothetical protein
MDLPDPRWWRKLSPPYMATAVFLAALVAALGGVPSAPRRLYVDPAAILNYTYGDLVPMAGGTAAVRHIVAHAKPLPHGPVDPMPKRPKADS